MFLDIEAAVDSEEEEEEEDDEEEEDYDPAEVEEEISNKEDIFSHTVLALEYAQTASIDRDWATFLKRARDRAHDHGKSFPDESVSRAPSHNDRLYEIGCKHGLEELAVLKLLQLPIGPKPVYAAFARKSLPGRIFAEVLTLDSARELAEKIPGLTPHSIRLVPHDRMTETLEFGGKAGPRAQMWVRMKSMQKRYKAYVGDLALVSEVKKTKEVELWLIPRIGFVDGRNRPGQFLFDEIQARQTGTGSVRDLNDGRAVRSFRGQRYSRQGYLIVSGSLDLVTWSPKVIPTAQEFTLFRGCEALDPPTHRLTEETMLWNSLNVHDRVKAKTGCFQGLSGIVHELTDDAAYVYFASLGISEFVSLHDLRKDFRHGDQVVVTSGEQKDLKGWVVDVLENTAVVFNSETFVEVLFLHLEFHEDWEWQCLRDLSGASELARQEAQEMKYNPNGKFVGKEVMVIGARHFKACRGVIRDTTFSGEALVELAIFNHPKLEKFKLNELRLVRDNRLLETGTTSGPGLVPLVPTPLVLSVPAPSTPLPGPDEEPSPAWDPSSDAQEDFGEQEFEPPRWLADPRLRGIRVTVTEYGCDKNKHLEVKGVNLEVVTVRDRIQTRELSLNRVVPVTPTRKEDPVVSFAENQDFGKLFTIKTFGPQQCKARRYGSKSGKGEVLHELATATLAVVYPPFKGNCK